MAPFFSAQSGDMERYGAISDIEILLPLSFEHKLTEQGIKLPDPIKCSGLIDTGTEKSCISTEIIKKLGLEARGISQVVRGTDTLPCLTYPVRVQFSNSVGVSLVSVIGIDLEGIEFLIGRDILSHGVLIYSGYSDEFTLGF